MYSSMFYSFIVFISINLYACEMCMIYLTTSKSKLWTFYIS